MGAINRNLLREMFLYEPSTGWLIRRTRESQNSKPGRIVGTDNGEQKLRVKIKGKSYLVHRLNWLFHFGWLPEFLDHKNGDPLDNRIENLRPATRAENNRNVTKRSSNTSGYKGVSFFKSSGKWRAAIRVNGASLHIGYYDTPEDAHQAYCDKGRELHGDFFRG